MPDIIALAPKGIALFNAIIFLDSLRYKFTDHPKTRQIFGRLDDWASCHGATGIFSRRGLFSQYVIGGAELIASMLMIVGAFYDPASMLMVIGALLSFALMSGAIGFHLFTPLGIDPNKDGGGLFRAACVVWLGSAALIGVEAAELVQFASARLA